ncbi:MAG: peptidase U32 family protein [Gammaproteobacteria bacterium]|nr:MAG: peptidase U32 family protein [Gammaproteobacteria bacterium]
MELVCPAGNYLSLKMAVNGGADAVYIGFNDDTNARSFAGLNFNTDKITRAIDYAHQRNVKVFLAVNTYPQPQGWDRWKCAIDRAAELKIDTVIAADISILEYASNQYPDLRLHLSVQGSATNYEALRFYQQNFGIQRAVLPRVLSLAQVKQVAEHSPVELEVFAFGSLCIMAEGRCHLSSYVTGESPNMSGVCSPAKAVKWEMMDEVLESRLNDVLIDRYQKDEHAGYPTLCKGRFRVNQQVVHALETPTSLNTLDLIPELDAIGVKAVKIEGRQRSPAYVKEVTDIWRQALDHYSTAGDKFIPRSSWQEMLAKLSEGSQTTLGAYSRPWQ